MRLTVRRKPPGATSSRQKEPSLPVTALRVLAPSRSRPTRPPGTGCPDSLSVTAPQICPGAPLPAAGWPVTPSIIGPVISAGASATGSPVSASITRPAICVGASAAPLPAPAAAIPASRPDTTIHFGIPRIRTPSDWAPGSPGRRLRG